MADIILQTLKIDDQASAALEKTAAESEKVATAERAQLEATSALTDAEKRLYAQMVASQTAMEQRAKASGLSVSELKRLEAATMALAAAEARQQAAHASATSKRSAQKLPVFGPANYDEVGDQLKTTAAGMDAVTKSADIMDPALKRAAFGAKNLRYQLADIGTTIIGGMNPFVVLAQQGPDVVHAFDAGGGAAVTLKATFGGLATQAAALAPILAAVGVAVAALGTTALVVVNDFQDGEDAMTGVNRAILETGDYSKSSAADLKTMADGLKALKKAGDDAAASLAALKGDLSKGLLSGARSVEQIRADASPALLAAGQRVSRTQRELQAAEAAAYSGDLTGEESIKRQRELRVELQKATKELSALKEARDSAVESVNALSNAEEQARLTTEREKEAKKSAATATKELRDANREAAEWTREAMRVNAEYYAMLAHNTEMMMTGYSAFYEQSSATKRFTDSLRPLIDATNELAPPATLDRLTQLNFLLMQLNTEAARSPEAAAGLKDSIARTQAALAAEKRGPPIDPMALIQSLGSAAGALGAGGGASAGLGALGGVAGAAGMAGFAAALGPFAAVFAAVAGLAKLVDRIVITSEERQAGQKGIAEKGSEAFVGLMDQVGQLPDAILDQLQRLDVGKLTDAFTAAVHDFAIALIEDLPEIITTIVEMVPSLLTTSMSSALIKAGPDIVAAMIEVWGDPETWKEIGRAVMDAIKASLANRGDVRDSAREARSLFSGANGSVLAQGKARVQNISLSGVVGDTREVVRTVRDRLGAIGTGLGLTRDQRWGVP